MFNLLNSTPPTGHVLIAECPEWCDEGFQICKWNGREFYYDAQPNDMFHKLVVGWKILINNH